MNPETPNITLMPAEQFDELIDSLDIADEVPTLAELGKRERRYHHVD